MKIAVTPFQVVDIPSLAEKGADIFIIGNDQFANRLVHSFSTIEIAEANKIVKSLGKEMYINMNLIMHNDQISKVDDFLQFIKPLDVDGIVFSDLGIYMIAKRLGMQDMLIYNPETLNTSTFDPTYWTKKGIKGVTISREVTLDDITEIAEHREIEISLIGHGHLNMFHSRRPLIENFFKFTKEEYDAYIENRNLHLVEEIRNEKYPIFQDAHGTHIFREKALESFQEIHRLKTSLDVFIIDGIFKNNQYLEEVVKDYVEILNSSQPAPLSKQISEQYQTDHDSGFLYKKTVYDKY